MSEFIYVVFKVSIFSCYSFILKECLTPVTAFRDIEDAEKWIGDRSSDYRIIGISIYNGEGD